MKRINLTDGSTWFDAEKADVYKAVEKFDGENFVDVNTGDQFAHQELYHTISGRYILHTWSGRGRGTDTYESIGDDDAYGWLLLNNHADAIPQEDVEARNLDATPGETPKRNVRISDELWAKAQSTGNASKLIVDLLTAHFAIDN